MNPSMAEVAAAAREYLAAFDISMERWATAAGIVEATEFAFGPIADHRERLREIERVARQMPGDMDRDGARFAAAEGVLIPGLPELCRMALAPRLLQKAGGAA